MTGEDSKETASSAGRDDDDDVHQLPPTDMLYMTYEGNSLTQCDSKILSIQKSDEDAVQVFLDQTVMHAQGRHKNV